MGGTDREGKYLKSLSWDKRNLQFIKTTVLSCTYEKESICHTSARAHTHTHTHSYEHTHIPHTEITTWIYLYFSLHYNIRWIAKQMIKRVCGVITVHVGDFWRQFGIGGRKFCTWMDLYMRSVIPTPNSECEVNALSDMVVECEWFIYHLVNV